MTDDKNGNDSGQSQAMDRVLHRSPSVQHLTRTQAIEAEMDPDMVVERILAASEALDRLTIAALKMTDSRCWDNMQGKPRLNAYGASLLIKKIGLRVHTSGAREIESGKDANGPYFIFQCTGEISHPLSPAVHSTQGTCDSRNKFHTTRYEEVRDDNGNLIWEDYEYYDKKKRQKVKKRRPRKRKISLEAHQVQRSFIAQQAHTLCKTKGVAEFLGLDRMEWDEVERHSQARRTGATSVLFEDRSQDQDNRQRQREKQDKAKREAVPEPPPKDPSTELASGRQRALVYRGFVDAMKWGDSAPSDAATQFYSWVTSVLGPGHEDKTRWTVLDVDKLLATLETSPLEPSADGPDDDNPPPPTDADEPPPAIG
jgi:hypothetical protein